MTKGFHDLAFVIADQGDPFSSDLLKILSIICGFIILGALPLRITLTNPFRHRNSKTR